MIVEKHTINQFIYSIYLGNSFIIDVGVKRISPLRGKQFSKYLGAFADSGGIN